MKSVLTVIFSMCVLLSLAACGNAEGGQQSLDYDVVSKKFVDAIFAGKFEDAKSITLPEYKADVSEDISQFSVLYTKYEIREMNIASVRAWGQSNIEEDKRIEVVYQYAEKGTGNWAIGNLQIRVLTKAGLWGVADLLLIIPTD